MNTTTDEYLLETFTWDNDDGTFTVHYEAVDNPVILSLQGCIYRRKGGGRPKASHPFWWHREGDPVLFFDEVRNSKPRAVSSRIDNRTGMIRIKWDSNPGDHMLCVSYSFDDSIVEEPTKINWVKEGF